ncbi:hypothetical protein RO3G_15257 [Rhizopus delemar RA 99-880]|uniref:Uncharacterized protein n=1 Tax=Rhizopus delemar (strain RA 99-880 / ATCC MYA-4621 / FGSC 9543 / NRRL 43880) TaxID=246409 RepID=I1CQ16_RHIO9|nr:hypothetical protein RO3G_15257 [Rhizopus delemar RA 99-880]|eukprot:EIE90546.1 hypothetical protein RO3G_15257 [Rhizopus delemar RA 99-880]
MVTSLDVLFFLSYPVDCPFGDSCSPKKICCRTN